jgi:superfamily II DNA/RNA helicase
MADRRIPDSPLREELWHELGLDPADPQSPQRIKAMVVAPHFGPAGFARLAPLVDRLASSGDPQAEEILQASAAALAAMAAGVAKALDLDAPRVCAVGGAPIFPQVSNLRRVHNIVIGTPGRLKDLVERKALHLADFKTVVLDEADRMLDMGFINDMRFMLSHMSPNRHTLFFSATMSPEVGALINQFLKTPVMISVKTRDTSKNIDQDVVRVHPAKKVDALHDLLSQPDFQKVIIFGRTKHGVERLSETLLARGFKAVSIHGDKNHSKRQQALRLFKQNEVQVMVATDVAARGLDIADISHVINYDLPQSYEDYVHRIGRTGRGNKTGKALTFIDQH